MVTYKVKETEDVYSNLKRTHPFPITDLLSFSLPIKEPCSLNYIELYFATYHKVCAGNLVLAIKHGDRGTTYKIRLETVKDNVPLRFTTETNPKIKEDLEIHIKVEQEDNNKFSIWTDGVSPCVTLNADVAKVYKLKKNPLVSIIMPVYKSDLKTLKEAIKSVKFQHYMEWELCLVDDGSKRKKLKEYLESLKKDSRIKVKINKKNQGIAAASQDALRMATGDYIGFLDHDDLLHKEALLNVVKAINKNKKSDFIYTDEDKIDEQGNHTDAFYKPDWSYDMFLSQMYTCHFSVYRADVLYHIDGFDKDFDGAQDYDLALRVIESIPHENIIHIPKVLYHWRKQKNSTALNYHVKPEANYKAVKAIQEHLNRSPNRAGNVYTGYYPGTYRVSYNTRHRMINIIIPTKDNVSYLRSCIESVANSKSRGSRVLVVDNGSKKRETLSYLSHIKNEYRGQGDKFKAEVIKYDKAFNFSAINNFAAKQSFGLLLFLNDDTEVLSPWWLDEMMSHLNHSDVGVVGAKLLYPNRQIQHAGVIIGIGGIAGHSHKHLPDNQCGYFSRPHITQNVSAVTGACLMTTRDMFDKVGGFDEKLPRAFNDIDFCLKVRKAGYNIVYTPHACLLHYESVSRGLDNHKEQVFGEAMKYMEDKWKCSTYKDPYYNENLTLVDENYSFSI